jgi:thioredoxin reductase (NADPH)
MVRAVVSFIVPPSGGVVVIRGYLCMVPERLLSAGISLPVAGGSASSRNPADSDFRPQELLKSTEGSPMPASDITLYGATWCPDCRRSKKFLSDQRVPFDFIDLEVHPEATAIVEGYNDGKRIIPTIVFADGSILVEPTNEELAEKIGLHRSAANTTYDVVIIGGGPTGLTTAIYAAREDLRTVVIERSALGGQAGVTDRLDNYPGFPDGIKGADLAERFAEQAARYGVELLQAVAVTGISATDGRVTITTSTGQVLDAGAALVATGSTYRRTGAEGEDDLIGSGIHFCATCDGPFYKGAAEVVVIGGGNSAFEESLFLTQFVNHLTILVRGDAPNASRLLQDKVAAHPKISVILNANVTKFVAKDDGKLGEVVFTDATGTEMSHPAVAAFVFVGLEPNSSVVEGLANLDAQGVIITDRMLQTSVPGVFAAGDVRLGSTKQLASAVGEGAAVALQIRAHLDELDAAHVK